MIDLGRLVKQESHGMEDSEGLVAVQLPSGKIAPGFNQEGNYLYIGHIRKVGNIDSNLWAVGGVWYKEDDNNPEFSLAGRNYARAQWGIFTDYRMSSDPVISFPTGRAPFDYLTLGHNLYMLDKDAKPLSVKRPFNLLYKKPQSLEPLPSPAESYP